MISVKLHYDRGNFFTGFVWTVEEKNMLWLIAMTLTRELSGCNTEFKSSAQVQVYFVRSWFSLGIQRSACYPTESGRRLGNQQEEFCLVCVAFIFHVEANPEGTHVSKQKGTQPSKRGRTWNEAGEVSVRKSFGTQSKELSRQESRLPYSDLLLYVPSKVSLLVDCENITQDSSLISTSSCLSH